MYYDLGGLDKDSILESSKFSLEIIQSLRNIFPRDNEIDFVYNKMLHKYENEITKLKQND